MSLYWINAKSLRLAIAARPRGGDWLGDDLRRLKNSGVDVLVSMLAQNEMRELGLMLEQEECCACGMEYRNFPIEDRGLPGDISRFKEFVDQIATGAKEGKSVAIHCRAGIGRSSLLLCSVLVQLGFTCNQAWGLVQDARGCPVPDTSEQKAFAERFVNLR